MSSKVEKIYPFDVYCGKILPNYQESKIMCEQVKSVSKKRLVMPRAGKLPANLLAKAEVKLKKVLAFEDQIRYFLFWRDK